MSIDEDRKEQDESASAPPAGSATGTMGGLTSEDLQSGFGVTGGPGTTGEADDTKGVSGNRPDASATSGG
jgi:hypothetical protein